MRLGAILIISFFIYSCNDKETKDIFFDTFPEIDYVKGESIKEIEFFSSSNVNLVVVDSFLVVQRREDTILSIYSTNTHKLLSRFGSLGRGPGEFIQPELLKQVSRDISNNSPVVHVYDYGRRRFSTINIIKAINNQESIIQEPVPDTDFFITYFHYMDDSRMIATPENTYRFMNYNFSNDSIKYTDFLPKLDIEISAQNVPIIYISQVVVNKEKEVYAAGTFLKGELDFFDMDGNYVRSTIFDSREDFKDTYVDDNLGVCKAFIVDIESNDGIIYALNWNNNSETVENEEQNQNLEVLTFDWNGKPIKKVVLNDHRYIQSFTYDKINNRIYAYAPNEENHNLLIYNLK